jgi:hypothetical protein
MENTAGPSIFKSTSENLGQSASQISKNPQGWFKSHLVRIIIVVLIIGVLAEVFFGAYTLFSPSGSKKLSFLPQQTGEMTSAKLSLIPDKTSYKKGDTVTVDVKLFTGSYVTDSADVVIKYDPAFLQASSKDFAQAGNLYSEYPAVQVDEKNGLIGISGITLQGQKSFSGTGVFAKLNFKALKDGQTEVTIEYQPESTADSNVLLTSSTEDILGSVGNASINISPAVPSENSLSGGQSCESFTISCQDQTGKTGTQVCQGGSMQNGSCGYDPVLTTSCGICETR